MAELSCDMCRSWKRETYDGTNEDVRATVTKRGECRAHAPQAMHGEGGSCFEWPVTQEDDWCGDWYPSETGLAEVRKAATRG